MLSPEEYTAKLRQEVIDNAVPCRRCHCKPIIKEIDGLIYFQCPNPECITCQLEPYQYLGTTYKSAAAVWNMYHDKNSDYNKEHRKHHKEVNLNEQ